MRVLVHTAYKTDCPAFAQILLKLTESRQFCSTEVSIQEFQIETPRTRRGYPDFADLKGLIDFQMYILDKSVHAVYKTLRYTSSTFV